MDQNKRRIFDCEKNEYTFRSLRSLIKSLNKAIEKFQNINFELDVTDTNSSQADLNQIKEILTSSKAKNKLTSINLNEFKNKIKDGYSKAKFANMANFYNSLLIAKNEDTDLIYFVEDDYLHTLNSITEMIFSYEKFYSLFNERLFFCHPTTLIYTQKMRVLKFILEKIIIGDWFLKVLLRLCLINH